MQNVKESRLFLRLAVVLASLGGVLWSLVTAKTDGYSHWSRRLLYFTAQSNVWIGATELCALILENKVGERGKQGLYVLRFVFTVSISLTGLVFCLLLAPFSDSDYTPWTLPNTLTHVVAPFLALAVFFTDPRPYEITPKQAWLCVFPPLIYFLASGALGAFSVDFGRGVPYPYFFLNHRSPAGVFGFSSQRPFFVGSFYWLILMTAVVAGVSFLLLKINKNRVKKIDKRTRQVL